MAMIPSIFGGRRSNIFDPFSLDILDPTSAARETSAIANTRIDWKETPEAHIFKVDVPGLKKEEVKVEVEEGRVLQISGERSREHEEKNEKWQRMIQKLKKYPQPQALLTALAEDDPEADFLVELLNRALSYTELKEVFDYDHIPDDVMQWALAQTVQVATIQAPAAPLINE